MFDNNYNKNCGFSEQTISYLYGEITADRQALFEAHLENCAVCADDIAGFGLTRSAVTEWKETDFQSLNTPKIEFPAVQMQPTAARHSSLSGTNAWLNTLRNFFAVSPIWAAGLLFFLISGGLLLVIQSFKDDNQIAAINNEDIERNVESSDVTSRGNKQSIPTDSPRISQYNESSPVKSPDALQVNPIVENKTRGKKIPAVKVSVNSSSARENLKVIESQKIKYSYGKNSNTNPLISRENLISKPRIPKLNNIEDDEEDSTLRLTDLLSEAEGK